MSRINHIFTTLLLFGIVLIPLTASAPSAAATGYKLSLLGKLCCAPLGICYIPGAPVQPRAISGKSVSLVCDKSGNLETIGESTTGGDGSFSWDLESDKLEGVKMPSVVGLAPCNVTVKATGCLAFLYKNALGQVAVINILGKHVFAKAAGFIIA